MTPSAIKMNCTGAALVTVTAGAIRLGSPLSAFASGDAASAGSALAVTGWLVGAACMVGRAAPYADVRTLSSGGYPPLMVLGEASRGVHYADSQHRQVRRCGHQRFLQPPSAIRKIAFLGDYLPRKCGIATFTSDLRCAVAAEFLELQCLVVPVNDLAGGYDYPAEVRFEIAEQDLPSYLRAADFLNITDVDVVCVEHEFGIFGGPAGS